MYIIFIYEYMDEILLHINFLCIFVLFYVEYIFIFKTKMN